MDFENNEAEMLPSVTDSDVTQDDADIEEAPPKRKLPLFCIILYAISAICGLLYVLFVTIPEFSDFFNKYISSVLRAILSHLTSWIPFSLAEYLLLLVPVIIFVLSLIGIKHYGSSWRNVGIFCLIVLSVVSYIFSSFTLAFVPAYRGSTLDKKMGLDKQAVSAEELYFTALILADKIHEEIDEIKFTSEGTSVMPYGYDEMDDKLMAAYSKACDKYDFIQRLDSNVKRVMLSEPMTYTHISGVYTFFTGEANLNVNFPDYSLPNTAAHELAHQRGIAREDEANFVAFLVCSESDDAYLRYSAYLNLYEHVISALYSADRDYYSLVYYELPKEARQELVAFSEFFDKYRDSVASNVSETVNDTFLTINGTEGTKSYGMVVDLAVAYYKAD